MRKTIVFVVGAFCLFPFVGSVHAQVAHWKLDDGVANPETTTAVDSSGNGYDGTLVDGPVWDEDNISGYLIFDGDDDYIEFGDILNDVILPVTVAAWVNIPSGSGGGVFASDQSFLDSQYGFWVRVGPLLTAGYGDGDNYGAGRRRKSCPMVTGAWVHVAAVISGPVDMVLYINGVDQGGDYSGTGEAMVHHIRPARAGMRVGWSATNRYFTGRMDDLRVYASALTQEDITLLATIEEPAENTPPTITPIGDKSVSEGKVLEFSVDAEDLDRDYPLTYQAEDLPPGATFDEITAVFSWLTFFTDAGEYEVTFIVSDGEDDASEIITITVNDALPAFPGAEGFGAPATGGRGGTVIHVTNLNDSGAGSLRQALQEETEPRIIVFDVGGTIELESNLTINRPARAATWDFTLAGQTAPGGIVVTGASVNTTGYQAVVTDGNFIIRHMRLRGGHQNDTSPTILSIASKSNFILDHMSFTGAGDETTGVSGCFSDNTGHYWTFQWSTFEESGLWGQGGIAHDEGNHNFGPMANSPNMNLSFHHNLMANHTRRFPRLSYVGIGGADVRNNVMFNSYQTFSQLNDDTDSEVALFNVIGNCYVKGANTVAMINLILSSGSNFYPPDFIDDPLTEELDEGNLSYNSLDPEDPPSPIIPLEGWHHVYTFVEEPRRSLPVETQSAEDAFELVLDEAGAWPRDATTRRTIEEVETRGGGFGLRGPYEHFDEVVDGPCSTTNDTDRDGMPNVWEEAHDLDPNDPEDGNDIVPVEVSARHAGYTYVEFYINELADNIMGISGTTYTIQTGVDPVDSGTVMASHGVYGQERFCYGGYNSPNWLGTVPFGMAVYNEDSIVIMKAKPLPGYVFDHWSGGTVDALTATQVRFVANENITVKAVFVEAPAEVAIDATVAPAKSGGVGGVGDYRVGDVVTLAAYSVDGYQFKQWNGTPVDGLTNPVVQFPAADGLTIEAEFEVGDGGDVLIDDFDDQDNQSELINSESNPKKWWTSGTYTDFHDLGGDNYAFKTFGDWGRLILGYGVSSDVPETATYTIPDGVTVLKFRIYNIDDTDEAEVVSKRVGTTGTPENSEHGFDFLKMHSTGLTIESLFYADPLKFPTIASESDALVALPINLLRTRDLSQMMEAGVLFRCANFGHFIREHVWDAEVAIDDVAFGRAQQTAITAPNAAPVSNAGRDQTTRDVDGDGSEVVLLNGLFSYDGNADLIDTWTWSVGGEEVGTGFAPSVEFDVGVHTVTLTVTDGGALEDSDTCEIVVLEQASDEPGPGVVGGLFLDTDDGANGTLKMYSNGAWRTVKVF